MSAVKERYPSRKIRYVNQASKKMEKSIQYLHELDVLNVLK